MIKKLISKINLRHILVSMILFLGISLYLADPFGEVIAADSGYVQTGLVVYAVELKNTGWRSRELDYFASGAYNENRELIGKSSFRCFLQKLTLKPGESVFYASIINDSADGERISFNPGEVAYLKHYNTSSITFDKVFHFGNWIVSDQKESDEFFVDGTGIRHLTCTVTNETNQPGAPIVTVVYYKNGKIVSGESNVYDIELQPGESFDCDLRRFSVDENGNCEIDYDEYKVYVHERD